MTQYQQTGDGFGAKDWVTIIGPDVFMYLSDGSRLSLLGNDPEAPSAWRVELIDSDGVITEPSLDQFPFRAGALEWSRRFIKDHGLTTVPTEDQRAAPWYGKAETRDITRDNGLRVIDPPGKRPAPLIDMSPTKQIDPDEFRKAMEMAQAIDLAASIDRLMKAGKK